MPLDEPSGHGYSGHGDAEASLVRLTAASSLNGSNRHIKTSPMERDSAMRASVPHREPTEPASSGNAVLAASVAGIGAFVFGYSMGFTSPVLTAMTLLKDDAVFTDATLNVQDGGDTVVIQSSNSALFSSIVNVGAMCGAILGGVLCDKVARMDRGSV
jgi:hypothetical protein